MTFCEVVEFVWIGEGGERVKGVVGKAASDWNVKSARHALTERALRCPVPCSGVLCCVLDMHSSCYQHQSDPTQQKVSVSTACHQRLGCNLHQPHQQSNSPAIAFNVLVCTALRSPVLPLLVLYCSYFKKYNYQIKETGEVILFEGIYAADRGQAAAVTFYTFAGALFSLARPSVRQCF